MTENADYGGLTVREQEAILKHCLKKGIPTDRAVTFADMYLPDRYSKIRSRSTIQDFRTQLTPKIGINLPFISANMKGVTGPRLAKELMSLGGLSIIPQMDAIEERLGQLDAIRRADCALIDDPLTIAPHKTLKEARVIMERFGINSLVVVDEKNHPIGMLSNRDWFYENDDTKKVSQLMGGKRKLYTAPAGTPFADAARILRECKIEKLPLVNKNGKLVGLLTTHGLFYERLYPRATRDNQFGRFLLVGSVGVGEQVTKSRLLEVEKQVEKGICMLLIDTARAFSDNARDMVVAVKKRFPDLPLMVGNTSSAEGTKFLIEAGADIVKIGIGPGKVCRTRRVGIGTPQVTAIAESAAIANLYGKTVVGDGGMEGPDDVTKAVIAGASAIMSGSMFIQAEESEADTDRSDEDGSKIKVYQGSASFAAQKARMQNKTLDRKRRPEGVAKPVKVVGTVEEIVEDLIDGMSSAMSYLGVWSVKELREKSKFPGKIQTSAGLREGTKR
ncbi:MAG: IMP dehydrogenase [Patescibacteria group bacterium]